MWGEEGLMGQGEVMMHIGRKVNFDLRFTV